MLLNAWFGRFYNLLQNSADFKNNPALGVSKFFEQMTSLQVFVDGFSSDPSFIVLAMPYVLVATLTAWFTKIYTFRWREAMTFYYLPKWRLVTRDIEGSSQRIQEDCARFARIIETLGLQVVRAILTLVAFLPLLWQLSSAVMVPGLKGVAGSLVWVALGASVGGVIISWFVGIMLPGLEYTNQRVEARFRKQLVLAEDNKEKYAKLEVLQRLFQNLRVNYQRLFLHYGYFDIWQYSYGQLMIVVPLVIVGPSLFTGLVTLGSLMQINNAFDRVHASFDVFLQNWTTITELRSIRKRLLEFERLIVD